MKILVIGGTRYFGKRLVHSLLGLGHSVWVLSRGQAHDNFGDRVVRLLADRNDRDLVKEVLGDLRFDCVVDQVLMTGQQAQDVVDIFAGKISYYLMTSTMAVYDLGANLTETKFIPSDYLSKSPTDSLDAYREGKRAAENVIAGQNFFKTGFARFPIVLGEDDYTQRLEDQIRNIRDGRPVYFPNLDARISFINSEDAARALEWMIEQRKGGSYNFSAKDSIKLRDLVMLIENAVGKSALLSTTPINSLLSPFGFSEDWTLDVNKAETEGFMAKPLSDWLSQLISKL